jgi:hypothetical protein
VATVKNVGVDTVLDPELDGHVYVDTFGNILNYISGNHCTEGTSLAVFDDVSIADIDTLRNFIGYSKENIPKSICRA